ncbi:MAG: acyltransferase family protein [Aestuariivirgaceae bacterium]
MTTARLDWIDYCKGICIILVVMVHSTLGVEKALGEVTWLNGFISWAKPFRMPDFFLISGLFLSRRIAAPWRIYLDRKVVHFGYFYFLWMTIQLAVKSPGIAAADGLAAPFAAWLDALIDPFGTLWFIYLLAVFFLLARLLRPVPAALVWITAALLEAAPIDTGNLLVDEFAARFVYFYTGYLLGPHIIAAVHALPGRKTGGFLVALALWAAVNTLMVAHGIAHLPVISLALGLAGAGAVILTGLLLARTGLFAWVRRAGENSIVIYLAFFLFMAGTRWLLLEVATGLDPGMIALIVTTAGVVGPLVLHRVVQRTRLAFLFERPPAFHLVPARPAGAAEPARSG